MLRVLTTAAALIASTVIVQAEASHGNAGRSSAHVYMFTGLIGVGSGLDGLAGRIERRDVPSTMSSPGGVDSLARVAIDRYRSGRLRSIVIVGYSTGARSALEMAACLGAAKVPVKLLVTIDGMSGPPVSSNVRKLGERLCRRGLRIRDSTAQAFRWRDRQHSGFRGRPLFHHPCAGKQAVPLHPGCRGRTATRDDDADHRRHTGFRQAACFRDDAVTAVVVVPRPRPGLPPCPHGRAGCTAWSPAWSRDQSRGAYSPIVMISGRDVLCHRLNHVPEPGEGGILILVLVPLHDELDRR